MGNPQDGSALLSEMGGKLAAQGAGRVVVEIGKWLVYQNDRCVMGQSSSHRDSLPHASRKCCRIEVCFIGKAYPAQPLSGSLFESGFAGQLDVLKSGAPREQSRILEDDSDSTMGSFNPAGIWGGETSHSAQQSGLSRAGRSHYGNDLPGADIKREFEQQTMSTAIERHPFQGQSGCLVVCGWQAAKVGYGTPPRASQLNISEALY